MTKSQSWVLKRHVVLSSQDFCWVTPHTVEYWMNNGLMLHRTSCSGQTRLALHVPSSSWARQRKYNYHSLLWWLSLSSSLCRCWQRLLERPWSRWLQPPEARLHLPGLLPQHRKTKQQTLRQRTCKPALMPLEADLICCFQACLFGRRGWQNTQLPWLCNAPCTLQEDLQAGMSDIWNWPDLLNHELLHLPWTGDVGWFWSSCCWLIWPICTGTYNLPSALQEACPTALLKGCCPWKAIARVWV